MQNTSQTFIKLCLRLLSILAFVCGFEAQANPSCPIVFDEPSIHLPKTIAELVDLQLFILKTPQQSPQLLLLKRNLTSKLEDLKQKYGTSAVDLFKQNLMARLSKDQASSAHELEMAKEIELKRAAEQKLFSGPSNLIPQKTQSESQSVENQMLKMVTLANATTSFKHQQNQILLTAVEKKYFMTFTEQILFNFRINNFIRLPKFTKDGHLGISDDGKILSYYGPNEELLMWDLTKLSKEPSSRNAFVKTTINLSEKINTQSLLPSNDGKFIIISNDQYYHHLVDTTTGRSELLRSEEGQAPAFHFSPNSKALAGIQNNSLAVRDLTQGLERPFVEKAIIGDYEGRNLVWNSQSDRVGVILSDYLRKITVITYTDKEARFDVDIYNKNAEVSGPLAGAWDPTGQHFAFTYSIANGNKLISDLHIVSINTGAEISIAVPSNRTKLVNWSSPSNIELKHVDATTAIDVQYPP